MTKWGGGVERWSGGGVVATNYHLPTTNYPFTIFRFTIALGDFRFTIFRFTIAFRNLVI